VDEKRNPLWLVVGGLLFVVEVVSAQSLPAFEVASVRENRSGGVTRFSNGLRPRFPGDVLTPVPGQISITNSTLRDIVVVAYGLDPARAKYTLKSERDEILQKRFDIVAKPPEGALPSQTLSMLRTLLGDRFRLRTHTETQQVRSYVLTLVTEGKLGPGLRQSPIDCTSPSMPADARERARLGPTDAKGESLCGNPYGTLSRDDMTIRFVSPLDLMVTYIQPFVDRPIVNETGLSGSFEWTISFSPVASLIVESQSGISVSLALREQLGLKLEPQSRSTAVLVIDSVEMPTPN
jgi:uncharacterized protein (TIGR03435 family)